MRMRRPTIGRVGTASDGRPSPLPKNQLQSRIEAQQNTIKSLEIDKSKLNNNLQKLLSLVENDLIDKLPKKLQETVSKTLEDIRDELD